MFGSCLLESSFQSNNQGKLSGNLAVGSFLTHWKWFGWFLTPWSDSTFLWQCYFVLCRSLRMFLIYIPYKQRTSKHIQFWFHSGKTLSIDNLSLQFLCPLLWNKHAVTGCLYFNPMTNKGCRYRRGFSRLNDAQFSISHSHCILLIWH